MCRRFMHRSQSVDIRPRGLSFKRVQPEDSSSQFSFKRDPPQDESTPIQKNKRRRPISCIASPTAVSYLPFNIVSDSLQLPTAQNQLKTFIYFLASQAKYMFWVHKRTASLETILLSIYNMYTSHLRSSGSLVQCRLRSC